MKLTKRKGFNFFRSYYDVYNELENDKDKIAFIEALLDRQFLGIKPTDLKGMAKFAYISQTNSIDSQVSGYEMKTKTILTPTVGGWQGGTDTPTAQEKGKGKEKGKEEYTTVVLKDTTDWSLLLKTINKTFGREFRLINQATKSKFKARFKDGYSFEDILKAIKNCSLDNFHKENAYKYCTVDYFSRSATLDRFNQEIKQNKPEKGYYKHLDTLAEKAKQQIEFYERTENGK